MRVYLQRSSSTRTLKLSFPTWSLSLSTCSSTRRAGVPSASTLMTQKTASMRTTCATLEDLRSSSIIVLKTASTYRTRLMWEHAPLASGARRVTLPSRSCTILKCTSARTARSSSAAKRRPAHSIMATQSESMP